LLMPLFFFLTATATTEIYTLSLHDALPILTEVYERAVTSLDSEEYRKIAQSLPAFADFMQRTKSLAQNAPVAKQPPLLRKALARSEEHTSELQSRENLVCRLLLEKKKHLHK